MLVRPTCRSMAGVSYFADTRFSRAGCTIMFFGYYSGPSNRLERHFQLHQERFYQALIRGEDQPLRPLFYARNVHSNFVLLAFFLEDDPEMRSFLRDQLGIVSLDSVLFVMQKPPWRANRVTSGSGMLTGTVEGLLDRLYALALAPMRRTVRITIGLRRRVKTNAFISPPGCGCGTTTGGSGTATIKENFLRPWKVHMSCEVSAMWNSSRSSTGESTAYLRRAE